MKICVVCPRLCHGGAERVAVSLANGFIGRGHDVAFFTDLFEEQTYFLDPRVGVQGLVAVSNPKIKKWWSAIGILRKYIKKERPNVVIGIMPLCSIIARIAVIGTGIPVIATEHNSYETPVSAPLPFMTRIYKFHFCKVFKCVTVLTEADKKVLGRQFENAVVMENPLALEPILSNVSRNKAILASGRVDNWHYKGFDVLIRAFGKLVQGSSQSEAAKPSAMFKVQGEGWKLVIAGVWRNPETRTYLDGIAKECGVIDKIEYLGFVEDMQSLYQKSSIFVLSSRFEAFGLVLIEAMSQGCACIACDYKGRQKEIMSPKGQGSTFNVQGSSNKIETCETGILCEPDNVEVLADAMAKMITDDVYRERVRAKAVERSKYYSVENTMDRWESLLIQVADIH